MVAAFNGLRRTSGSGSRNVFVKAGYHCPDEKPNCCGRDDAQYVFETRNGTYFYCYTCRVPVPSEYIVRDYEAEAKRPLLESYFALRSKVAEEAVRLQKENDFCLDGLRDSLRRMGLAEVEVSRKVKAKVSVPLTLEWERPLSSGQWSPGDVAYYLRSVREHDDIAKRFKGWAGADVSVKPDNAIQGLQASDVQVENTTTVVDPLSFLDTLDELRVEVASFKDKVRAEVARRKLEYGHVDFDSVFTNTGIPASDSVKDKVAAHIAAGRHTEALALVAELEASAAAAKDPNRKFQVGDIVRRVRECSGGNSYVSSPIGTEFAVTKVEPGARSVELYGDPRNTEKGHYADEFELVRPAS